MVAGDAPSASRSVPQHIHPSVVVPQNVPVYPSVDRLILTYPPMTIVAAAVVGMEVDVYLPFDHRQQPCHTSSATSPIVPPVLYYSPPNAGYTQRYCTK